MKFLDRFLSILSKRQDLAFLGLLIATIGVMIVPIPPYFLDVLIALNLTLTITVLLVAVYLDRATSFSTFPAVILLATTFRLAISISTTRSVLSVADGGEIVNTFGQFATGGNIAIGLVIFLIIAIVQFVVVTKGAERVAEVAARFTLDALPGRQMSIDADLRAGTIDQDEARRRRQQIDKENQFFGAMDGAMKFVKGDAITGLLIVAVNLIGGLVVGVAQHKMPIGAAASTYSLLTIGDGLVSQIPALIIAMSAGIIITRVTSSDNQNDLGTEIVAELTRSNRGLSVVGIVVMALGFVPGFPTTIFLLFGGAILAFAVLIARGKSRNQQALLEANIMTEAGIEPRAGDRLIVHVCATLNPVIDASKFRAAQTAMLRDYEERMGLTLPMFGVVCDLNLAEGQVVIAFDGVPLAECEIEEDQLMALADATVLDLLQINHQPAGILGNGREHAHLVNASARSKLVEAGVPIRSIEEMLVDLAIRLMTRKSSALVGFDLVQTMIRSLRSDYPELADQLNATVPTSRFLDVLRRLASEGVPLKPLRVLSEAMVEWSPRCADPDILTEYVRRSLGAQICNVNADANRRIAGYIVEPDLEQALRASIRQTDTGDILSMSALQADRLLQQVGEIRTPLDPLAPKPVIITSPDLRRHLRAYFVAHEIDFPVLSYGEISREFNVHPVGTLSQPSQPSRPQLVA